MPSSLRAARAASRVTAGTEYGAAAESLDHRRSLDAHARFEQRNAFPGERPAASGHPRFYYVETMFRVSLRRRPLNLPESPCYYSKIPDRLTAPSCHRVVQRMPSSSSTIVPPGERDGEQRQPRGVAPVASFAAPSIEGRKNPPSPPAAPTTPVMIPIRPANRCGTS